MQPRRVETHPHQGRRERQQRSEDEGKVSSPQDNYDGALRVGCNAEPFPHHERRGDHGRELKRLVQVLRCLGQL